MAILGLIFNVFSSGSLDPTRIILWIAFWLTFVASGNILSFSLCGAYVPMMNKFSTLIWAVRSNEIFFRKMYCLIALTKIHIMMTRLLFQERGYIVISLILYSIGTILSFISWGASCVSKIR